MNTTASDQYLSYIRSEADLRRVRIRELHERIEALRRELWTRMDRQSGEAAASRVPFASTARSVAHR